MNHQQQLMHHLSLPLSDNENHYETVYLLAICHLGLGLIGTCYLIYDIQQSIQLIVNTAAYSQNVHTYDLIHIYDTAWSQFLSSLTTLVADRNNNRRCQGGWCGLD